MMVCTRAQPQKSGESVAAMILGGRFVAFSGLNLLERRAFGREVLQSPPHRPNARPMFCRQPLHNRPRLHGLLHLSRRRDGSAGEGCAREGLASPRLAGEVASPAGEVTKANFTKNDARSYLRLQRLIERIRCSYCPEKGHFWCSQGKEQGQHGWPAKRLALCSVSRSSRRTKRPVRLSHNPDDCLHAV